MKSHRINHSNQVSPIGCVIGKLLGMCNSLITGPKVLDHYLQPAGEGGTTGSFLYPASWRLEVRMVLVGCFLGSLMMWGQKSGDKVGPFFLLLVK